MLSSHQNCIRGTLLIADISGFTRFVRSTDIQKGRDITRRLLFTIMESNFLYFEVSEIEGDAVLFYKLDSEFSAKDILKQYEGMLNNFNQQLFLLKKETKLKINLTLKLIVHYGNLAEYTIGQFKKLYGEPVIEAHRLLKNSLRTKAYILLTRDFL